MTESQKVHEVFKHTQEILYEHFFGNNIWFDCLTRQQMDCIETLLFGGLSPFCFCWLISRRAKYGLNQVLLIFLWNKVKQSSVLEIKCSIEWGQLKRGETFIINFGINCSRIKHILGCVKLIGNCKFRKAVHWNLKYNCNESLKTLIPFSV